MQGLTQEQIFLLEQARQVWADRAVAKAAGVPWQEETITDILIKNIRLSYPGHVEVIPFSKPIEGESGADWLLSFINSDQTVSATMLVQAKRLDDAERDYPGIGRRIGEREPPELQIDQLIATARTHSIPALYAFYNHVSDPTRVSHLCASLPHDAAEQLHGFGISIAAASAVKAKLPDQTFDRHQPDSIPFHCLLCTKAASMRGTGGSPAAILKALREKLGLRRRRIKAGDDKGGPDTLGFLTDTNPVVSRARAARSALAEGVPPAEFGLPAVAGLIILTDGENPLKTRSSLEPERRD
jgi:hypothetical protein